MKTREFYQIRKETAGSEERLTSHYFSCQENLTTPCFCCSYYAASIKQQNHFIWKGIINLWNLPLQSTHISKSKFMKDSIKHNVLDVSSILSKAGFAPFLLLSLTVCHQPIRHRTPGKVLLSIPIWWPTLTSCSSLLVPVWGSWSCHVRLLLFGPALKAFASD